ncbi:Hypothetical predicted protein [Octopus vulgaris]|uniref:Uncharacterized protein n=1 Tax=Octopus vulgaris TaxID=6645 RepID=A0AA36ALB1_OCTVU|nr:Hypothetical predicted protein [Octopus vulgaris]
MVMMAMVEAGDGTDGDGGRECWQCGGDGDVDNDNGLGGDGEDGGDCTHSTDGRAGGDVGAVGDNVIDSTVFGDGGGEDGGVVSMMY